MYKQKKYRYSNIIDVVEYHSAKYGAPGEKRQAKTKPTPAAVRKQNQRRREENAERMIHANFNEGDLVRTLTFAKDKRPADMKEAQKIFRNFYNRLRKAYRKEGFELCWMANIECTERNAWHVHMICNRIKGASELIKDLWFEMGGVHDQILKDLIRSGKKLGAYITKTPESTEPGEHKVTEAKFSHSRNLEIPEAEEKVISGWKMTDKPRPPKGFYLIKESYFEGVNEEGYRYRRYKFAGPPRPPKEWRIQCTHTSTSHCRAKRRKSRTGRSAI